MNNEIDSGGMGCWAGIILVLFAMGNARTYPMLSLAAVALLLVGIVLLFAKKD